MNPLKPGQIGWVDLTVPDAEALRVFYGKVVGWRSDAIAMDGYSDYCMIPPGSDVPVAGVCHARGENSSLPPQWLMYITVADLDRSLRDCESLGGKIVVPAREMGGGRFAVIRDPAGAVSALFQSP